jgi:hypothetical protein
MPARESNNEVAAGLVAGAATTLAMHPLDVLKVRLQGKISLRLRIRNRLIHYTFNSFSE